MNILPIFALILAPNPPAPINDLQMQDIGCVAVIGIAAFEQRSGGADYPDVRETGKRWAGIVGDRIMEETGQPREVVALAIQVAVKAEQENAGKVGDPGSNFRRRFDACKAAMDADLATADGKSIVVTDETNWQTDEPGKIALYRLQLGEDRGSIKRSRQCHALLKASHNEITSREGAQSRDALAMGRLVEGLAIWVEKLPTKEPVQIKAADTSDAKPPVEAEPDSEEKMARCIRLGESLALALPPE